MNNSNLFRCVGNSTRHFWCSYCALGGSTRHVSESSVGQVARCSPFKCHMCRLWDVPILHTAYTSLTT